jgi:2-polyprenyl-3-methyl-5-hydroxy-6-metoxy-1,4-benzoquinol methylase
LTSGGFWERPETVDRFASRDPDHRLQRLIGEYGRPAAIRALDLGCAGGRNTVLLAQRGFDVRALDASSAMVERTR